MRYRAAVDAHHEGGIDIVTFICTMHSLDEAIERCQEFMELGADVTLPEAPRSVDRLKR